ncbi:ABC transporter, ATP-binding protein [Ancylostoma ceylanicum]|uniref:ABC transporter, ATP-binding protein n=1 Tax=Ancylostoma ceylanicum TaxID=53326 RepID=A0A0D6LKK7_9BILA|nr:ABC transporter, ATP-binding protein [Ancylostoma ceylanicum]
MPREDNDRYHSSSVPLVVLFEEKGEKDAWIVNEHVEDAKTGELNGCQLRFELPRSQQERVMRMGEVPSREADEDVFQDNSVLELQEGFFARIIQQLQYIWLKRIIEISHNISLIVNQITHHRSSKWAEHWPKEFPWAVLGVIIRSQGAIANGSEAYYWLLPSYLYYKEQTLFHLISDVEYAAERVFHFKHQQFLAGLSPLLFWVATIIWDSGVIVVVAGIITLVMKIFKLAVTRMFMPLICAYCVAMLPMVYVLSLLIDTPGVAKSVSILYQIGSAALGFVMLFQGGRSEVPDGADIIEERERVENNISDFALAVQDLTKYHGVTCAVKKTTYGIKEKDCFGLVGASGAGKTSTFDVITGLRSANSGTGIGYCPQFDAMLPRLSCRQNMMVIAALNGYKYPKKVVDEMLRFLDLTEHSSKAFSRCSGGQRRRVGIGVALMNPSKLAILDEPTAGIDPKTRHQIWSLLKKMRASGKAIVLSSHSMEECEALCSRIGILVRGRLVAIGASQTLKTRRVSNIQIDTVLDNNFRHADNFFLHMSMTSVTHKDLIRQRKEDKVSTLYEKAQKMASSLPLKEFMLIQASLEDVLEILNEQYSGKAL